MVRASVVSVLFSSLLIIFGCGEKEKNTIALEIYTDSLFAVMKSDRTNYTKLIVKRLGPNGAATIVPDEHWQDLDNGAPLPAQMFRAGAEGVQKLTNSFTYSLQSLWPINKQNAPRTTMEKQGLQYIIDHPGENFYGTEALGDTTYYTAVYPDIAISDACSKCHNDHQDSPRADFKIGDVMGGVVIRVPLKN